MQDNKSYSSKISWTIIKEYKDNTLLKKPSKEFVQTDEKSWRSVGESNSRKRIDNPQ